MHVDVSNPKRCEIASCSRRAVYEVHEATVKRDGQTVDYGNIECCSFCRHIVQAAIEGRANMPKLRRHVRATDGHPDPRNAIVGRKAPRNKPSPLDADWEQRAARKADQSTPE